MTHWFRACAGLCSCVALAVTTSATRAQNANEPTVPAQTGVITGVVRDMSGAPAVGVRVQAMGRRKPWAGPYYEVPTGKPDTTDDRGRFRLYHLPPGRYTVGVLAPQVSSVQPAAPHVRTYAPGTASLDDATMVAVRAAEEQQLDLRIIPVRVVSVSGRATTADGRPAAGFELWLQGGPAAAAYSGVHAGFVTTMTASARIAKDGAFTLAGIPSGSYTATLTNGRTRGDEPFEIAEVRVVVADTPVTGLAIRSAPGATVAGRLEWAGRGPQPWPAKVKTLGRIRATGVGRAADFASIDSAVQPDGTFRFMNLYGARRIEAMTLPPDWVIAGVRGPQGVIVEPHLELTPGVDISGLRVVVTNRTGSIAARVVDEQDRPFDTAAVLLLPRAAISPDALGWGFHAIQRSAMRSGVAFYTIEGVLPGTYLAAAIDIPLFQLVGDAELMERTRASATPVDVAEGETVLRLQVLRLQPVLNGPP